MIRLCLQIDGQAEDEVNEAANAEREEAEDEAPESVQAQNQQQATGQQWSTFPDLLRVQDSKSRNSSVAADDHPAEGQEAGNSAPNPVPVLIPAARSVPVVTDQRRETGTVPKRAYRPVPVPIAPDLTTRRADMSVRHVSASSREPADFRVDRLDFDRVSLEQQRSTDEAKEAELRQNQEVQTQLAALSVAVQSLNHAIDSMSQSMNRRLDQMESRLNSLVSSGSTVSVDETASIRSDLQNLVLSHRLVSSSCGLCLDIF